MACIIIDATATAFCSSIHCPRKKAPVTGTPGFPAQLARFTVKTLCRIRIRLDNLLHNLEFLRATGKPLMPVVKADAYGHGLLAVAATLAAQGVDHFAVGAVAEGVELRRAGLRGMVVALLGLSPLATDAPNLPPTLPAFDEDARAALTHELTPLVHDWHTLERLAELTRDHAKESVSIALKCDTGMARLGFLPEDMPLVLERLTRSPQLRPDLLVSHMAVADAPEQDSFTQQQATRFREAARSLCRAFPGIRLSLGNSACLLAFPELAGDLARPGFALYGGNPFHGTRRDVLGLGLAPVMEVLAPILEVHPLRAGQSLGYGRAFVAPRDMTVAVAGIGYADGFRRVSGAQMNVNGMRAPVVGRVAMQMSCLDVTGLPPVKPGDMAHVLGGEKKPVRAEEVAEWWGTIPYEVTCLLGRIER